MKGVTMEKLEKDQREEWKDQGNDYKLYKFSKIEWVKHLSLGFLFLFSMGMLFFDSLIAGIISSSLIVFYIKEKREEAVKKRQSLLLDQFKESMYALTSALSAGRSVEQAFTLSLKDLEMVYGDKADIVIEWRYICFKLLMNETIESAMEAFAKRSGLEEINNFSEVFAMAKRSGGNLVEIIADTSQLISEKIDIQKEIDILIVQKQFEQKILSFIIPGMILFFGLVSPDFLEPLYVTLKGRLIMILALGMYFFAGNIGKKIVAIEV